MRREFADATLGGKLFDDVPNELLRNTLARNSTSATHTAEQAARVHSGGFRPVVQQAVDPIRDWNGSNVASFSAQVHDCPVSFALLKVAEGQTGYFVATQSAGEQYRQERPIPFALDPL